MSIIDKQPTQPPQGPRPAATPSFSRVRESVSRPLGWRPAGSRLFAGSLPEVLTSIVSMVTLVGLWWVVAALVVSDPVLLPTPGAVAVEAVRLADGSSQFDLWSNAATSLARVGAGWGAAVLAGVTLGILMASNRFINAAVDPLIEFLRPIPPLGYAPLVLIWFGIDERAKFVILFMGTFVVVTITTVSAIRGVDLSLKRAALSLGASRSYLVRRVILRAALPEIVTAMRLGIGITWATLVAAEIFAADSGLGYMILEGSRFLNTSTVFVGIVVIGLLAFSMDRALRVVNARLNPWRGRA